MAFPFFPYSRMRSLRTSHLEKFSTGNNAENPWSVGGHVADIHPDLETSSTDSSPSARSRMHVYGLTPITSVLQEHHHQAAELPSCQA